MKKFLFVLAAIAAISFAFGAQAEEKYVAGGFEASGHINTGFGFSHLGDNYLQNTGGAAGLVRDGWAGVQNAGSATDFGFLLDEVELNLTKTFGENIKFRSDIAFGDGNIGSTGIGAGGGLRIEQAYVTANIAVGNGVELLVGRFDAPIGFESVDRNENDTITRSSFFNAGIRPRTLTGAKFYYAFSDAVDWHFYIVNNLEDGLGVAFNGDGNIIPSAGTRVGYTWGEEGTESTVGLSVAAGPEALRAGKKTGRWSYLADLDWNFWATDAFAIGGEGIFRIDNSSSAAGEKDAKFMAGLLNLHYVFSDVWDGTLKYALLRQNAFGSTALPTGAAAPGVAGTYVGQASGKAYLHEIGAAGGYQITDGAKFGAEYRLDWSDYKAAANKNFSHAFLGNFAYTF